MAATALLLDGWTRNGAVGTEYAAVAGLGPQQRFAAGAFVIKLARIDGHGLLALLTAVRAGDDRRQYDFAHAITRAGNEKRLLDYNGGLCEARHL